MFSAVGAAGLGASKAPVPVSGSTKPAQDSRQVLFALVLTNLSWHPPTAPDRQELTILINSEQRGAAFSRLRVSRFRARIWKQQEGAQFNLWLCPVGLNLA